eukprot:15469877-Alexandrium_andersonii.AAC.1
MPPTTGRRAAPHRRVPGVRQGAGQEAAGREPAEQGEGEDGSKADGNARGKARVGSAVQSVHHRTPGSARE